MPFDINYGAWIEETVRGGKESIEVLVRIEHEEFAKQLKAAFEETKDIEKAIHMIRLQVIRQLQSA